MLEFNPFYRKRALDFLKMEIFSKYRNKYPEYLEQPSSKIELEVDKKTAYDYKSCKFKKMSIEDVKNEIRKEVQLMDKNNFFRNIQ